jgi:hypothetical protein
MLDMISQLEGTRFVAEVAVCQKAVGDTLRSLHKHFPSADYRAIESEFQMLNEVTPRVIPTWLPIEPLIRDWLTLRVKVENAFFQTALRTAQKRTERSVDNVVHVDFTKKGPAYAGP